MTLDYSKEFANLLSDSSASVYLVHTEKRSTAKSRKTGKNYAIGPFRSVHFYTRVRILNSVQEQGLRTFPITVFDPHSGASGWLERWNQSGSVRIQS